MTKSIKHASMRERDLFMAFARVVIFYLPLFLFIVAAFVNKAAAATTGLQIEVNTQAKDPQYGSITVEGVDRNILAQLRQQKLTRQDWQKMFSVQLRPLSSENKNTQLPNVAGRYEVLETGLRFVPKFAPTSGLAYHIRLQIENHQAIVNEFVLNEAPASNQPPAEVDVVYPSASQIPENTLRLYIHFSKPMRRGQVEEKIRLLDENDHVIQRAFVTGPIGELWDSKQQRLTLLLDPGRIKRGVAPNRELGPALEKGKKRTLHIDGDFIDVKGQTIKTEFRKTYSISEPIYDAISMQHWHITEPTSGTQMPLQIHFDRPLDSGMLSHVIHVYDEKKEKIIGQVEFTENETIWQFHPSRSWSNKPHTIEIPSKLEDISGNNLLAPLDVVMTASDSVLSEEYTKITFTPIVQNE